VHSFDSTQVISGPAVEPVTLSEAKDHLRVDGNDDDVVIGGMIASAREYVERIESELGVPVSVISVGPGRSQTIVRRDPFA